MSDRHRWDLALLTDQRKRPAWGLYSPRRPDGKSGTHFERFRPKETYHVPSKRPHG